MPAKRWTAAVTYETGDGTQKEKFHFDEFEELADLIENAPDWNQITTFEIKYNHRSD